MFRFDYKLGCLSSIEFLMISSRWEHLAATAFSSSGNFGLSSRRRRSARTPVCCTTTVFIIFTISISSGIVIPHTTDYDHRTATPKHWSSIEWKVAKRSRCHIGADALSMMALVSWHAAEEVLVIVVALGHASWPLLLLGRSSTTANLLSSEETMKEEQPPDGSNKAEGKAVAGYRFSFWSFASSFLLPQKGSCALCWGDVCVLCVPVCICK